MASATTNSSGSGNRARRGSTARSVETEPASRAPRRGSARHATDVVTGAQGFRLSLPGGVRVDLPDLSHLGWYAGVAVLAAADVIEWPVAAVLAVGKALADNRHFETLRQLGEALDQV